MDKIIDKLYEVLEPTEKYIESLNSELSQLRSKTPLVEAVKRLEMNRDSSIVLLLRSFKGTAIDVELKEKRVAMERKVTYTVYWVDRKKYFKVLKEPLTKFFNRFIQLVHQSKKMELVDIKLREDGSILLLIEMEDS
jgi:hypothetical protein